MNTTQIAHRLVEYCRRGEYLEAQRELYATHAISIEPEGRPDSISRGLEALQKKTREFRNTFDVQENIIGDPIVADPFFACTMTVRVKEKKSGSNLTLAELSVFEVSAGKIVREQFFYTPPPK